MSHILDLIPKWNQNYSFIQHSHFILITIILLSYQIPTAWVHSSKNFKIQQNETVMMTCVSNTIGVPTYGVNLWHHELRIGEERKRGERKRGRKRERGRCRILHRSRARQVDVTTSWVTIEHMMRLDWRGIVAASVAHQARGSPQVTPVHMVWLLHKSC
jgi:hypothetical protein